HTRFSRDWSSDVCSSDLGRGVEGGAEAEVGDGVVGLKATPEAEAEEGRVVLEVGGADGAGGAEGAAVGVAVGAGVGRDEGAGEIAHPLPDEAVHVVDAPVVGGRRADGRHGAGHGAAVPGEEAARVALLAAAV